MKKERNSFLTRAAMMLLAMMLTTISAWADGLTQSGDTYTITSTAGWDEFCTLLTNNDKGYFGGKTVKLGADITVTTMAGASGHDFTGTFDGDGHTLTVNYVSDGLYVAPFRYVESGCVIKNLNVTGSINTSHKCAAGIIGLQYGTVNLLNCRSSVIITSSVSGDGTHGGLVASNGNSTYSILTIEGSVFDGKLLTNNGTKCCGGLVGWRSDKATLNITNSLYAPSAATSSETWVGTDGSATFSRNGTSSLTNCYYTATLGTAQGKATRSVIPGENTTVAVALTGTTTQYTVSGITAYSGGGLQLGSDLYYGSGDQLALTLGNTAPIGYQYSYTASEGTLSGTTLTMPDADVTISTVAGNPIDYNITYNLNGGTVATANPATYNIETADFTLINPTRSGYTFTGWTGTDLSEATTSVTIASGSTGDREYTATWTPITYAISYTLNGGTVATANPDSYTIESADITLNNPTRADYTFTGWTGTDLSEATTSVTIASGSTGDRTYTANWTLTSYAINYPNATDGQNGVTNSNPVSFTIESDAITLADPSRTGYTFGGWYTDENCTETASTTIAQGSTGERTFYAKWTPNTYTVHFDANGGSGTMADQVFTYDVAQTLTPNAFTRTDYTFDGWDTDADGSGHNYYDKHSLLNLTTENNGTLTLYAQWIDPSKDLPLTFEAIADGEITVNNPKGNLLYTKNSDGYYSYYSVPITVSAGDIVEFYGNASCYGADNPMSFECSADCYVYGNIMSLIDGFYSNGEVKVGDYSTTLTEDYAFAYLFYNNSGLKSHPTKNLVLPATTLTKGCYKNMFSQIVGFTRAPELPATTLAEECYYEMFYECTGLTTAPELPATTLADGCYYNMFNGTSLLPDCSHIDFTSPDVVASGGLRGLFAWTTITDAQLQAILTASGVEGYKLPVSTLTANCYEEMFSGCTNLTTAPDLPAATLAEGCYSNMFNGCSNLSYVKCLANDISATNCTNNWLSNIRTSGTFIGACNSWSTGSSGIPEGWRSLTIDPATEQFYDISLQENVNASIQFSDGNLYSVDYAPNGRTVTLTAPGYTISSVTVTDANSNIVEVTNTNGGYTFEMPASDVTVTAMLTGNTYTVSFHTNGGTGSMDSQTFTYGQAQTLNPCTFTAPEGRVFSHWNTAADGSGTSYASWSDASRLTTEATVNLYAQWAEEKYTVPLTLEFPNDGTITIDNPNSLTMHYSINGGEMQTVGGTTDDIVIPVTAGQAIQLYGNGTENETYSIGYDHTTIHCSTDCYIYGNIMSLVDEAGFALNKTLTSDFTFFGLFVANNHLKNHATEELLLPATTLTEGCYQNMFGNCTALTQAPELPATEMKTHCYNEMFAYCQALIAAPTTLPATTLADFCYEYMFYGCSNLTVAPTLPATELASICYGDMFAYCSKLQYIEMLAETLAYESLQWWVGAFDEEKEVSYIGVAATGIFVKSSKLDLVTGYDGIPTGWTVLNATDPSFTLDRTLYKDGAWNTLCLPISMTAEQVTEQLAPAALMTLGSSSFEKGVLTLNFVDANAIKAGKPYIIKWESGDNLVNPTLNGTTAGGAASSVKTDCIDFIGTYFPVTLTAGDTQSLYLSDANTLYYPSEDVTIGACRAYFKLADGLTAGDPKQNIKAFVLNFDEESESNGISTIDADAPASDGWFTLDGRRLLEAPVQPGLYIRNGHKVLLK